jgi:putative solute:sodium symporter small subunit
MSEFFNNSNMQGKETTDNQNTGPNLSLPKIHASLERYWRKNIIITLGLLMIWAAVGLGCGVLLADWFNQYKLPGTGFPLGFWFAHQGSIILFVLLILAYCVLMNRLDAQHHNELEQLKNKRKAEL